MPPEADDLFAHLDQRMLEWVRRDADGTAQVGSTYYQGAHISTAFFPASNTEDYETMVFPPGASAWVVDRYKTQREAEAGHYWSVMQVISDCTPPSSELELQMIDAIMHGVVLGPPGEFREDGLLQLFSYNPTIRWRVEP